MPGRRRSLLKLCEQNALCECRVGTHAHTHTDGKTHPYQNGETHRKTHIYTQTV